MRTTITINDKIYRALKTRAAETDSTVSLLIEDAVKYQILEDLEDLEDAKARENEPVLLFADLEREFREEGLL